MMRRLCQIRASAVKPNFRPYGMPMDDRPTIPRDTGVRRYRLATCFLLNDKSWLQNLVWDRAASWHSPLPRKTRNIYDVWCSWRIIPVPLPSILPFIMIWLITHHNLRLHRRNEMFPKFPRPSESAKRRRQNPRFVLNVFLTCQRLFIHRQHFMAFRAFKQEPLTRSVFYESKLTKLCIY